MQRTASILALLALTSGCAASQPPAQYVAQPVAVQVRHEGEVRGAKPQADPAVSKIDQLDETVRGLHGWLGAAPFK